MAINNYLPIGTSILMFIFAASVLQRFFVRRSNAFLFWGLGLLMFGLSSLSEIYLHYAWSPVAFSIWYLFGAILTAAWIGQGTVYLLIRKSWVHGVTLLLLSGSLTVAYLMLLTPLDASSFVVGVPVSEQYKNIMLDAPIRSTTLPFNIYGSIALVGGAVYSGYLFWRKRVLPNRVAGNVLIAAGGLSIGTAGILTRLGYGQYLFLGELVSVILMYAGFRMAASPGVAPAEIEQPALAVGTNQ